MSKAKKYLSIFVAVIMAVSVLFTGCSGSSNGNTAKKNVKLTWWCNGAEQADIAKINDAANKYLKDTLKKNYTVELNILGWGNYDKKASTALTTGQKIDVMFTANWACNYQQYAAAGYFTPLNDYLKKYSNVVKILGQDFLNASQINGKNYAVPTNKEKARSVGYIIQKKYIDKYNIDLSKIKSDADMETWFAKIKAGEPGIWGVYPGGMSNYEWDDVVRPTGLYAEKGSTKIINTYTEDKALNYDRLLNKWYKLGYINPALNVNSDFETELKTGKYFSAVEQLKPGKDSEETNSTGVQWQEVVLSEVTTSNNETTGAMLGIPKASENKDEAMDFISLLYTDKYLVNLYQYGIEGEDYTKGSDGRITTKSGAGYSLANGWLFGNQFNDLLTTSEATDKWQKFEEFNNSSRLLDSLGFQPNTEDITTQVAACQATMTKYTDLTRGQSSNVEQDIANMKSDFKADGIDTMISNVQKQYDTWRAKKGS